MYPQARGPANRYSFIIIYPERIARQDFFRITVPVTGKYRNEFPFNFSLPSSPFYPTFTASTPFSPLSFPLVFAYCNSTDRVSKHLSGSKQGEARDERLFTIPEHVHLEMYGVGERDRVARVALLEGIGRWKRATIWSRADTQSGCNAFLERV